MLTQPDQKLQVQQASDIVRLIGEHVSLRPRGKEFLGICPFHEDTNPSMHVSPVKQIYKCFSCGAGGDAYSFVMNYHKLSFPEALKYLAERAGIRLQVSSSSRRSGGAAGGGGSEGEGSGAGGSGGSGGESSDQDDRQHVAEANRLAGGFFRHTLQDPRLGESARAYLESRGITPEMVELFQIGFAPDRWDGIVEAGNRSGWSLQMLEMGGVISQKTGGGGYYDRFRNRLMFPIFDLLGRPIAFGARRINPEDEPKYLNSPESVLFHKSSTLFALHLSKKAIIDTRTAVVVEGYTDVIACHQAGITNVVATLGTALTKQHVTALSRLCDRVILIFDPDAAGMKAADRAVEIFLSGALDVSVAMLPEGADPADLLAQPDGLDIWKRTIDSAPDALEYKFDQVRRRLGQTTTLAARERLAQEYLLQLTNLGLQHWMKRSSLTGCALAIQRIGAVLGMTSGQVEALLRQVTTPQHPRENTVNSTQNPKNTENLASGVALSREGSKIKARRTAERHLIGCLLHRPELFYITLTNGQSLDEALTASQIHHSGLRCLYQKIYDYLSDGHTPTLMRLLSDLAGAEQQDLADLATEAELEVEQGSSGVTERIEIMLKTSAQWILANDQELEYHRKREELFSEASTQIQTEKTVTDDSTELLRELAELRRENPSPIRIVDPRQIESSA